MKNPRSKQELVEAEREARQLSKQKKAERKEAFLNAQKQLLKTSEYISELDKLSHELADCIHNTSQLFGNEYRIKRTQKKQQDIVLGCKDMNDLVSFHSKKRRVSLKLSTPTANDNSNNNNQNDNDNDSKQNILDKNDCDMSNRQEFDITSYNINPLINSLNLIDSGNDIFSMSIDIKVHTNDTNKFSNSKIRKNKYIEKKDGDIDILSKSINLDSSDNNEDMINSGDNSFVTNRKSKKSGKYGLKRVSYMSHLMNNIDIPFLSTFQDLQLLVDNIQSCLYSSTIILPMSEIGLSLEKSGKDEKKEELSENKFKDFGLFIQSREVLVNKLVTFLIQYAQNGNDKREEKQSGNKNENENENEKEDSKNDSNGNISFEMRKQSLFENILPYCFYSLMIILYQSSQLCENQRNDCTIAQQSKQITKQFISFVQHLQKQIENVMEKCFEIAKDDPSLFIVCLNNFYELLMGSSKRNDISFEYNSLWKQIRTSFYKKRQNEFDSQLTDNEDLVSFLWNCCFHAPFYQCIENIANSVSKSFSDHLLLLFERLSFTDMNINHDNSGNDDAKSVTDGTESVVSSEGGDSGHDSKKTNLEMELSHIMQQIQNTLISLLLLDNHEKMIQSQLLSYKISSVIIPKLNSSTVAALKTFLQNLEMNLKRCHDSRNKESSYEQEYLEIGVCCESLEIFIVSAINDYKSHNMSNDARKGTISNSLEKLLSEISTLKKRSLKYWSDAMSDKLFDKLLKDLNQRLHEWSIYETYYANTLWKCIYISEKSNENDEITITIPCQPSEYIHEICFQFMQILLMITTEQRVPNTIIKSLENEFRESCAKGMNKCLNLFLKENENENNDEIEIEESFALQLYFDVSFAKTIFNSNDDESAASCASSNVLNEWNTMLDNLANNYIDIVTMDYIESYLKKEIDSCVNRCLLMYGVSPQMAQSQLNKNDDILNNDKKNDDNNSGNKGDEKGKKSEKWTGGDIFSRPKRTIPRITLLPVASYEIETRVSDASGRLSNGMTEYARQNSISGVGGFLQSSKLNQDADQITSAMATGLDKLTTGAAGALTQANTLWKNLGTMWKR